MKTNDTEKHDTTPLNNLSGKEVAKPQNRVSKFTPAYWRDRVYRPTYTNENGLHEVAELWCRIQHSGRREAIGLGSNDKDQAARNASKLFTRVKAAGWTIALAEFAPDRSTSKGVPTVGEVVTAASASADVNPRSLRGYVISFRRIAAETYGVRATASRFDYKTGGRTAWLKRVDSIRLDKLTPKRVQAMLNKRITAAKGNPLTERKARITAASTLRQAKALIAPNRKLPFEAMPNPFAGVKIEVGTPPRYISTVKAGDILRQAKTELATAHPEAYKAFLLALGAGLRCAEIDNLQWQHIDAKAQTVRVMTTSTFAAKTDSSEREVFVDAGLIAELEQYRKAASALYVLESERKPNHLAAVTTYRAEITFDFLIKWLRAHGITAEKPIHTLRKEFGSLICQAADIYTASRQLGHSSIAVTAAYYTENRRRVAPQIGDMLNPQTEPKKGKSKKTKAAK